MRLLNFLSALAIANFRGTFGNLVTEAEFKNAVKSSGYPVPSKSQYNAFVSNLPKAGISTKQEAAMALAQYIHESDGLRAKREYACAKSGCPGKYKQSSCDAAGKTYYGRGYIQLTWCSNYKAASNDLYGDTRLVRDPDSVARDENVAWQTAFWFWKKNVHPRSGVSQGKFGATTRAINGGECTSSALRKRAEKRYQYYKAVRKAFALVGDGDERGCYN